jgi:hypothetical protein
MTSPSRAPGGSGQRPADFQWAGRARRIRAWLASLGGYMPVRQRRLPVELAPARPRVLIPRPEAGDRNHMTKSAPRNGPPSRQYRGGDRDLCRRRGL